MDRKKRSPTCAALAQKILAAIVAHDDRDSPGQVVALLSRRHGEGVTRICHELAREISRRPTTRLLCVDASFDGARLARRHGGIDATLGRDALSDPATLDAALAGAMRTTADGISMLALADAGVMRADGWPPLIARMRRDFDIILVDAGSLDAGTPYGWSSDARLKLLVVDASRTTMPMLERLRSDLKAADFDISGIVLNRMDQVIPAFVYRHLV